MTNCFNNLQKEQKVDFFVKCQELLIRHHPDSSFMVRESNLDTILETFFDQINKYKGYYYYNDDVCILWNHIYVSDPQDLKKVFKDNAYQPPHPEYNGVSIDFVVFRKMADCISFIKDNDEPRIKHVLFIREGKPRIHKKEDLVKFI